MQRKKFLALMLTAALVGQPGAPVSIMAAETDESSDFGSFGSEASDTAEKKLPVITEDLSEETITYDLNEKAEPLKVQTEESGKLKYLWLKSDDNENFYKIGKTDSQEKTKEEQTGEQQGENSQPEYEDTQEYTPVTDTAGTFYYKVRIWNSEETDENAYVESKTVCLQVLDPSAEDHSGLDATDGKKDGDKNVFGYNRLGIGRLIYQLPTQVCDMFVGEIFGEESLDSIDDETLNIIRTFFENNLNLSETSRQLYVHRNTLVYRFEKLQKRFGLDIRTFEDALAFKLAMMVSDYITYSRNHGK